ncbi:hypothetical protein N7478_001312 [Penicillium angulare]|uniref:uncharacterized protein n=1 Tax=Penicillium angulare TaxID=116970 RepID=UPI0025413027|nr:uncharacterized protein N7478_001312 [Penicillium angulare]KAJ5292061.1 hypothetical protein N7478_001312 [Penicillium angulare]
MFLTFSGTETVLSLLFTLIPGVLMKTAIQHPFAQLASWQILGSLLTATWRMAWVHQVIADKSHRSRYRRMLGYQYWPKIAPAAALQSISTCAALVIFATALKFGQDFSLTIGRTHKNATYEPTLVFLAIFITASMLIPLPATVIFSRVAASMLPAEDDPIVPFDRTFGGRVKPESLGGNGRVEISDALKTFGKSAWIRYVKLNLKVYWITVASSAAVAFLLIFSSVLGLAFESLRIFTHSTGKFTAGRLV